MNYPLRSNSSPRNKRKKIKNIAIILILAIIFTAFQFGAVRKILNKTALPFWKIGSYVSTKFSATFPIIQSKMHLISENRKLRDELNEKNLKLATQKTIEKENEELKALLGREDGKRKITLGYVLKKPSLVPFDMVIIDIGEDKGVKGGDKVFYKEILAIGEIEEVFANSSKVKFYSSPGQKFNVFVGPNSIQVEAEGLGGGNFMAKLPRGAQIKEGDTAVVPGTSSSIFGLVEKIEGSPADSFQKIIFKIPLNLNELSIVGVEIRK